MMPSAVLWLAVAVFAASLAGTGLVRRILNARAILDHPNARSSHQVPTPRGAGWAVVPAVAIGWLAATALGLAPGDAVVLWLVLAAALAALSWLDDLRGVSPVWRLLAQVVAVCLAIIFVARPGPFFGGLLPPTLDGILGAVLWVWYVNLFNFMDGIDGIAGVETATTGAGIALVAVVAGLGPELPALAVVLTAAALGFLWWNWQPARIFLGDIGSVPLGFLLGGVLLTLAAAGQWAPAVILPLYYLADATITLVRRAVRGERVWQAHRDHFYQQAVRKGASHARVSGLVLAADITLIGLAAAAAAGWVAAGLAGAAVVVLALLAFLVAGAGR